MEGLTHEKYLELLHGNAAIAYLHEQQSAMIADPVDLRPEHKAPLCMPIRCKKRGPLL